MKNSLIALFIITIVISCATTSNLIPRYGVESHSAHEFKKHDIEFVNGVVNQFGSKDSAYTAYIYIAWDYFFKKQLDLSMKRFNQAWLIDENRPEVYFGFAGLSIMKNDYETANKFIAQGYNNYGDSDCILSLNSMERALRLNNHTNGIIIAIKEMIKRKRKHPYYYNLGYYYNSIGEIDSSVSYFSKAIDMMPNDTVSLDYRAYIYQIQKKYELAQNDYNKI